MPEPLPVRVGLLAVAVGGGAGAVARWALLLAAPASTTGGFPWTVLAVNVVGTAVLASLGLTQAVRSRPWLTVGLGSGVCGGFTTMSTASVDGLGLLRDGRWPEALGYVGGTLLATVLVAVLLVPRAGAGQREVDAEGGDR